jgi:hypothetical protein
MIYNGPFCFLEKSTQHSEDLSLPEYIMKFAKGSLILYKKQFLQNTISEGGGFSHIHQQLWLQDPVAEPEECVHMSRLP